MKTEREMIPVRVEISIQPQGRQGRNPARGEELYSFHRNKESEEIHIHKVDRTGSGHRYHDDAQCRKISLSDGKSEIVSAYIEDYVNGEYPSDVFTEKEARELATELENEGYDVCGTCVSTLHKTR